MSVIVAVEFTQSEAEQLLSLLAGSWATWGVHGGQALVDATNKLSEAATGFPLIVAFEEEL